MYIFNHILIFIYRQLLISDFGKWPSNRDSLVHRSRNFHTCLRNLSYAYRLGETFTRDSKYIHCLRGGRGTIMRERGSSVRWEVRTERRRLRLKCDVTRTESRFRLSAKRSCPFKSAGASVQSTTGSRGVRISGSNVGYTMFRGSVKSTGYPLHSPVSPSLLFPCVTVCHHISTGVYIAVKIIVLNVSLRRHLLI